MLKFVLPCTPADCVDAAAAATACHCVAQGDDFGDAHDTAWGNLQASFRTQNFGVKSAVAHFAAREASSPFFLTYADRRRGPSEFVEGSEREGRERALAMLPAWYLFK